MEPENTTVGQSGKSGGKARQLGVVAGVAAVVIGAVVAGALVFEGNGSGKPAAQSGVPVITNPTSGPGGLPGHPMLPARSSGLGGTPFPSPPKGAVVFVSDKPFLVKSKPGTATKGQKAQVEPDVVALAVIPEANRLGLQASIVDEPTGGGADGLPIAFRLGPKAPGGNSYLPASPCGSGCYGAYIPGTIPPLQIAVALGANHAQEVTFPMPAKWPAPKADAIVARADTAWRKLHTLVWHDSLSDGTGVTLHTLYKVVAPNRLSFGIQGGSENGEGQVIIGTLGWQRFPGQPWSKAQQRTPVHQPIPLWVSAVDAHVIGEVTDHGRPAWRITFFDPKTPGWFTADIDKQTHHTMKIQMIADYHFMHDDYGPFNAPIKITSPK
jgi:hypothetical protein